jgi:serine/threonine protein kinase
MISYLSPNIPLRIVSEIGKGAYGQVYECLTNDNKSVAVKKIIYDKYGIRCLNEATIMSSIKHQHIAYAQTIYSDELSIYIVSQKAKTDLNKWTRKSKKGNVPDSKTLLYWTRALVSALSCLHSQGVIHCDMKASNVLFFTKNDVRLNDFTLSVVRHYSNKKYSHNICTSTHRPPEVWIDAGWNEKVDIWGLGCTLFEVAYGQLLFPYQGGNGISDEDIKRRTIDCLNDWGIRGPVQGKTFGGPKGNDFLPFELPSEFFLPENKLFNIFILSMLKLDPTERPSIFELQKHSYLNIESPFKKISFLVYSTEGYSQYPRDKLKMRLNQFLNNDMYDFVLELFSRSYGLKIINDIQLQEQVRIGICILIACKLLKQPLPLSYFTLSENMGGLGLTQEELKLVFKLETKFCEHLSFRIHISPTIAYHSSTSDS